MDVIFLAYANSRENPLPTLSREDEGVFSGLVNRALKGHFFIHRDSFSNLEKINTYLGKYRNRLALFLFSGHAGRDRLHLEGGAANAKGVAHQLGESARNGKLRIVILNGCSTAGQVKGLLDAGVPVVIATSAPVGDQSATAFSIRFFNNLSVKRMTTREAFEDALGPAQTATERDLGLADIPRNLALREEQPADTPLWGLYCQDPQLLDTNPLPYRSTAAKSAGFEPNEKLTETLYDTLLKAECRDIQRLAEKEEEGEYVEVGDKQTAIVNVLPFPVGIHLQKLLCPVEDEAEGFDKVNLRRLEQMARVYYMTTEMATYILLAQLWELKMKEKITAVPQEVLALVRDFFYLSPQERAVFDFLPFIRALVNYFETLPSGETPVYFVEELSRLEDIVRENHPFTLACNYLSNLRRQVLTKNIDEGDVPEMCEEAEYSLCAFFTELGFLHRYTLASIQNIDIQKYRHQVKPVFSHEMIKLMRAFGKPEQNYYLLDNFLDNRGVALLKGKVKVLNARKKQFGSEELDFLNLSPFIIDHNAFEANTDLSDLMCFDHFRGDGDYSFRNVKRPDSRFDQLEVEADGPFDVVHLQLAAFRQMILNETP